MRARSGLTLLVGTLAVLSVVVATATAVTAAVTPPRITNPATTYLAANGTFTVRGTSGPGAVVALHYHRAGTASSDYSIVRNIRASSSGSWARSSRLDADYRVFATVGVGNPHSQTVLFTSATPPPAPNRLGGVQNVYADDENTTLGVQFRGIDGDVPPDYAGQLPAGDRFVSIDACVRNRGPHGYDDLADADFELGLSNHQIVDSDFDELEGRPDLNLSNMAVNSLRCGYVEFPVSRAANVTALLFTPDVGLASHTIVWGTP